jgi:hypothetical protein
MGKKAGEGAVSDHYAMLVKNGHMKAPTPPAMPPAGVHVWNIFTKLHASRSSGGFGPSPISYTEMTAFVTLTGWRLDPWEVEAIRGLDDAYLATPRT